MSQQRSAFSTSAQFSNKLKEGGETVRSVDPTKQTTHYMKAKTSKGQPSEFVNSISIWENAGSLGEGSNYLRVLVKETLAPGEYFISAKKTHQGKVIR